MEPRLGQTKPICVVPDTNVWLKNPLLKDPLGAAFLFSLRQLNGYIGLPEVVEEEIVKNLVRMGSQAVESINAAYRTVLMLMGSADDYRVPSAVDLETSIKKRLEELAPLLKRVPFTLNHAKSALKRVNDGSSPNSPKNQQFKDSAIWEAVLELSDSCTVYFVTEDKGFFEDRQVGRGLAQTLRAECEADGRTVFVYHDLTSLLTALRDTVPSLDTDVLASMISVDVANELADFALSRDYLVGEKDGHSVSAFLTEKSEILAISFQITYDALDVADDNSNWTDYVIAKGDCLYNLTTKRISDIRLGAIEYHKSSGEIVGANSRTTIFGVGGITIGRKQKSYSLKVPLE